MKIRNSFVSNSSSSSYLVVGMYFNDMKEALEKFSYPGHSYKSDFCDGEEDGEDWCDCIPEYFEEIGLDYTEGNFGNGKSCMIGTWLGSIDYQNQFSFEDIEKTKQEAIEIFTKMLGPIKEEDIKLCGMRGDV